MTSFLASLLALALTAVPGAIEITRVDGTKAVGELSGWNERSVTIEAEGTTERIDTRELLTLRSLNNASPPRESPNELELIDGTRLPFTKISVGSGEAFVTLSDAAKPIQIRTDFVSRLSFRAPTEVLLQAWARVATSETAGDVVMIAKGEDGFDHLVGVVQSVTDDQVVFEWNGDRIPIKRSKVAGIAFFHGEKGQLPAPQCLVTTSDGQTIVASSVTVDGATLHVTTPLSISLDVPLDKFISADYSAGKLSYLSDLTPDVMTWTPRVAMPKAAKIASNVGMPRMNSSFYGTDLTLAWPNDTLASGQELRPYSKGLALRSRTELTYRLPAGMSRFTAIAGIDPATLQQGHVLLEIRADDRVVWEGEVDGKRPPVNIDVQLKSARRLRIRVDYGRNLDYGDRLHLVEARVTK